MAYIESVDDCDGLKFQHGPNSNTGIDWKNSGSVIQVSNDHDLLFIASKTVEVYKCSKFLSSLLDSQGTPSVHPVKHINVPFEIKRLRIKGDLLAIQGDSCLILYDFIKWMIVRKWDRKLVDFQWLNDSIVCIDENGIMLHRVDDDENVPEEDDSHLVSQNAQVEDDANGDTNGGSDSSARAEATTFDASDDNDQYHDVNVYSGSEYSIEKDKEAECISPQVDVTLHTDDFGQEHENEDGQLDTLNVSDDVLSTLTIGTEASVTQELDVKTIEPTMPSDIKEYTPPVEDTSLTIEHVQDNNLTSTAAEQTTTDQHARSKLARHMYTLDYRESLDRLLASNSQGSLDSEVSSIDDPEATISVRESKDNVHQEPTTDRGSDKGYSEDEKDNVESSVIVPEVVDDPSHQFFTNLSANNYESFSGFKLLEENLDLIGNFGAWKGLDETQKNGSIGNLAENFSGLFSEKNNGDDHVSQSSFFTASKLLEQGNKESHTHSSRSTRIAPVLTIPTKSEVISPEYEGYIASCISNPPSIACINEESFKTGSIEYSRIKLPDDLNPSDLESAIVVGCSLLPENFAAVSMVLNSQDTLICIIKFEDSKSTTTLSYAYNELYLLDIIDPHHISSRIESLWIPSWETLMVWSGNSTQVVIISKNEKLTGGDWKVLMMQEGYCLESTDGEMGTRGLSFSVHFRETLYRKNACADTPLLVDPPVFLLAQMDGVISMHCADVWSRQGEVQILDETMGIDRGSASDASHADVTSVVSIEDIHLSLHKVVPPKPFVGLTSPEATSGATNEPEPSSTSIPVTVTIHSFAENDAETDRSERLSNEEIIEKLYDEGIRRIWNLDGESEIKLEAIKLFEAFSNTLDAFEAKVSNVCDTDVPTLDLNDNIEQKMDIMDDIILKWEGEVKKLEKMQKEMMDSINTFECTLKPAPSVELPLEHKMLLKNAKDIAAAPASCSVDFSDFSIKEAEDVIEGVYGSLMELQDKLERYEKQVDEIELDLIFKKIKGSRDTQKGSLLPLSSLQVTSLPIVPGGTTCETLERNVKSAASDARVKFEELLDAIEEISTRDVSISLENLKLEKEHSPKFNKYQEMKSNANKSNVDSESPLERTLSATLDKPKDTLFSFSSFGAKNVPDASSPPVTSPEDKPLSINVEPKVEGPKPEPVVLEQEASPLDSSNQTSLNESSQTPDVSLQISTPTNDATDPLESNRESMMDGQDAMDAVPTTINTPSSGLDGGQSLDFTSGSGNTSGTAGSSIFSSSMFNTTGSIFGTDRPAESQPSTFGSSMFSAPVTYIFGQQSDVLMGSNLGSSGAGTSIFSTFASNTSFADIAASKSAQPPTGSFTGMSGFTSGNFKAEGLNFSSVQGLLGTSSSQNQQFGGGPFGFGSSTMNAFPQFGQSTVSTLGGTSQPNTTSGDLWTRARQSNPLD
ncbi:liver stage protein 3 like protein [Theileria equi strain WA]|uniref:Liver stage protein 3 like protein n=1 Tax=Theileria equi strain WA TaxID=1537102 RepID=L1LDL4_THEEQ|nr:liver stage protein 3 like protein [Theileria equi strain WA]EKX73542.1 liver stage protein 3 like protein [Theileria equi strain WA]|eukprot:XP_004832994.1 liver stage protein 3 like protein [Theileria equi strain WA]